MEERGHEGSGAIGRVASLAVALVAIALLAKGLYPADLPTSQNPGFVDNIFDNFMRKSPA